VSEFFGESHENELLERIKNVYQDAPDSFAESFAETLTRLIDQHRPRPDIPREYRATQNQPSEQHDAPLWDHRDVVLISYADQIRDDCSDEPESPLAAQHRFLLDYGWDERLRCIHLLPFFPSTSDDGFSVADYLNVDPEFGDWEDIRRIGSDFDLMFDLVLNHSSRHHPWFQKFLAGDPDYADFYATANPEDDLSAVVRPRALPLLTPFESAAGTIYVWTTFSADQVDLNYANPKVMLAMIESLIEYARRGGRIIRLDAIAFLWKQPGTSCLHLPQTHAAVQLMRTVLDRAVPGTLILTETNVPHRENISYFGAGDDEAHMVYQFSLPPLLLDAIHSGDTSVLANWMGELKLPSDRTTYFNFTASHDGIGVRPAEGLLPPERIDTLARIVSEHGGRIGMRANGDGTESPYELNITYLDAVADRRVVALQEHAARFLATQALMLAMRGIPAIYFHSLIGSPSDLAAVEASGIPRRINRHKYTRSELDAVLADADSLQRRVMDGYRRLLDLRRQQLAFAPQAAQEMLDLPGDGWIGWVRRCHCQDSDGPALIVLANLTDQTRKLDDAWLPAADSRERHDVLADERLAASEPIAMAPFQVRWIPLDSPVCSTTQRA